MPIRTLPREPEFTLGAGPTHEPDVPGPPGRPERTGRTPLAAVAAVVIVIGALAAYLFWSPDAPPRQHAAPTEDSPTVDSTPPPTPEIQYPVERIATAPADGASLPPLPSLEASDSVARDSIATILNGDAFLNLLVPQSIIGHIVASVDNLPRKSLATQILPLQPASGLFGAATDPTGLSIAHDNSRRYDRYVAAAESIDPNRLAQFYVRLYPLFQQAYVDLGYPNGYFNDRLIGVIDHLLAAPEPKAQIQLAQPKVLYEFADPSFEDLSAGQKILVRVGLENELRLKAKLREIRKALVQREGGGLRR